MLALTLTLSVVGVLLSGGFLASCSAIPGYLEPEEQLVVSALGFDAVSDRISVTAQIVSGADSGSRALFGEGESIEGAIGELLSGEAKGLEISHISIIALGKGIDSGWLSKILDYCQRNESIALSAQLVSASSAKDLLSIGDINGYDLTAAISKSRENGSVGAESRFYQVADKQSSDDKIFALPHFVASGDGFELYGLRIFKNNSPITLLNRNESAYYMMLCGLFDRGFLDSDTPGFSGGVGVSDCRTRYDFSARDGETSVKINLKITLDSELADDEYAKKICDATEAGMRRVFDELSSRHGDLFGLTRKAKRKGIDLDLSGKFKIEFNCEAKS